jgi:hypothetical protein
MSITDEPLNNQQGARDHAYQELQPPWRRWSSLNLWTAAFP